MKKMSSHAIAALVGSIIMLVSSGLCGVGALVTKGPGDYFSETSFLGFVGLVLGGLLLLYAAAATIVNMVMSAGNRKKGLKK